MIECIETGNLVVINRNKPLIGVNMKILVTGAKGQLGSEIVRDLKAIGIECIGTDIEDFDITREEATSNFIINYCPDIVIHCAGYTLVDSAEDNRDICMNVNYLGTKNIALSCKRIYAKLIYITTDYIFDGTKTIPYEVNDDANPLNVYGLSKLMGEEVVIKKLEKYFIIRVSWMFGHSQNNFVQKIIKLGKEKEIINVIDDQIGSPTYTCDVAELIIEIGLTEKYGVYHATNEGSCSWAEFAEEIVRQANLKCKISRAKSHDYGSKAVRPKNSRLSKQSLLDNGFKLLPTWQDALSRYLKKENVR